MTADLKTALVSSDNLWSSLGAICQEKNSWEINIPVPAPEYKKLFRRAIGWVTDSGGPQKTTAKKFIRLLCSQNSKGLFCSATLRNGLPPIPLNINQFHTLLTSAKEIENFSAETKVRPWHHKYTSPKQCFPKDLSKPQRFLVAKNFDELKELLAGRKDIQWRKTTTSSCHLNIPDSHGTEGTIEVNEENVVDDKGSVIKNSRKITVNEHGDHPFTFSPHPVGKNAIDVTETNNQEVNKDFLTKIGMFCSTYKRDGLTRQVCATGEWALNQVCASKLNPVYWRKRFQIPVVTVVAINLLRIYYTPNSIHHH